MGPLAILRGSLGGFTGASLESTDIQFCPNAVEDGLSAQVLNLPGIVVTTENVGACAFENPAPLGIVVHRLKRRI